jgi:uncharacterized membrane protein (DUF485 family)
VEVEHRLKALRKEQEQLTQKMSVLVLQSIFIFGIPAILGYFTGAYLENRGVIKVVAYVVPLLLTFILSWIILIRRLNSFKREVEVVESKIRELAPPVVIEERGELGEKEDLK